METCREHRGNHRAPHRGERGRGVGHAAGPAAGATFAEIIDVGDVSHDERRLGRVLAALYVIAALLVTTSVVLAAIPPVLQYRSAIGLERTAAQSRRAVDDWSARRIAEQLRDAKDYNRRLASSGQLVLGEAADPFTEGQGGSRARAEDSLAGKDAEYGRLLNTGDGVMGEISFPRLSIELPIRHGTSARVLDEGVGHLYGTSLPVGGASTHAVLTGHRGLVAATMFTRLDEARTGDFFYVRTLGRTLGYEVDRISVILPDQTDGLRVVPGEDRITLVTCTPYGVNTHRLLVSAHRVPFPGRAPDPQSVHDERLVAFAVALGVALAGWATLFGVGLRRREDESWGMHVRERGRHR